MGLNEGDTHDDGTACITRGKGEADIEGKEYELPLVVGTEGEKAIDISSLRKTTGYVTLDKGYKNTGSCKSAITFIDGEKGILRHRGYPIEELALKSTFTEVAYLLLYGELPTTTQLEEFSTFLNESSLVHEDMRLFFSGFPRGSHPMGILATMVASLSTFYPIPEALDGKSERQILANLISQMRTIAAISYKRVDRRADRVSVVQAALRRQLPEHDVLLTGEGRPARRRHRAGDRPVPDPARRSRAELQHLHGSDGGVQPGQRVRRGVGRDLGAVGIAPRRGQPGGHPDAVPDPRRGRGRHPVRPAGQGQEHPDRLMGFGHRVYKNFDPRAQILKVHYHKLLEKPGASDPLFDIALRLEEIALKDEYFISRNLYPNVDFYSGLILRAAGIPYDMFTVLFAIGRTPGWLAHWREMYHSEDFRIMRPRQVYVGPALRHYTGKSDRA